jgi:MraZ protein
MKYKWGKVVNVGSILSTAKPMILGEFQHTVDGKGRLAIPAKFREFLKTGAIVTRGLDSCLFLFSEKEWRGLAEKLIALPLAQANSRAFSRLMLSGASDVECDSQGRILVPEYLRTYAHLQKDVVITGMYNRIEIWDKTKWIEYKKKTENESGDIAEQLSNLGI